MPQPSITKICLKITFHSNFPGANKLIVFCLCLQQCVCVSTSLLYWQCVGGSVLAPVCCRAVDSHLERLAGLTRQPTQDTSLTTPWLQGFAAYCEVVKGWVDFLDIKDSMTDIKTLRPRQNGRHFPDNIFKCVKPLSELMMVSLLMHMCHSASMT